MGAAARGASGRITNPLRTYGGTDESSAWVYACVTKRAQALSGYPWSLTHPSTGLPIQRKPRNSDPEDFEAVISKPWQGATYFDLTELTVTDLDLCGDCFWLLDNLNGLGQPDAIRRLHPGQVKIAVNDRDDEVGYVLELRNGMRVPYRLDEIVHFKYPNPLNDHYGMGIVEALIRSVDTDLSQSAHVTAFFDQGAHLSGVLTVPETLGADEFERLKEQYEEEFARSNNSFRVLIAEQATGYQPIAQGPAHLGVVDLRHLAKDEILSGFGTPEFILGGRAQGGVYSMEEAQSIFYQAMVPLASRYSLKVSNDVAERFGVGFAVHPKQSDTATAKAERSRKLVGIGATIDDMREEAGLIRLNIKGVTDVPMIPSGLVPATAPALGPGGQPQAQPHGGGQPEGGPESDEPESGGDRDGEDDKPTPGDARGLFDGMVSIRDLLPGAVDALPSPADDARLLLPGDPDTPPPPLVTRAAPRRDKTLADMRARARAGLVPYFLSQRDRVIERLSEFGPARGAALRVNPKRPKSELDGPALWDADLEASEARGALASVVDQTMERAWLDVANTLGVDPALPGSLHPGEHPALFAVWPVVRRDVIDALARDLCEEVRADLFHCVEEATRRSYSVAQIANGFGSEGFGGILAVYDKAVGAVTDAAAAGTAELAYDRAFAVAQVHFDPAAVGANR